MNAATRILLFSIAISLGAYLCVPVDDPDLGWHIVVGRWILNNQTVPHTDYWTAFGEGKSWVAYSWLPDVIFASIDRFSGLKGLLFFSIIISAGVVGSLLVLYTSISGSAFYGAILAIFISCSFVHHFSLRPQTICWIYFALVIYLSEGLKARANSKSIIGLAVIFALWANTHISFVIGLLGIIGWTSNRLPRKDLLLLLGCCVIATFLTPYFGREWLIAYETSSHPVRFSSIAEFQPANIFQYGSAFLILVLLLLLVIYWQQKRPIVPVRLLTLGILLLSGCMVVKFQPFALVWGGALIAEAFHNRETVKHSPLFEGLEKLRVQSTKISPLVGVLFCLAILIYNSKLLFRTPESKLRWPIQSVNFILEKKLPFPLLNSFSEGGYLLYRFSTPEGTVANRVTVDGRTNLISNEDWSLISRAFSGGVDWKKIIDRISPKTILWPAQSSFRTLLIESPEWCEVFAEAGKTALFVQREIFIQRQDLSSSDCSRQKS